MPAVAIMPRVFKIGIKEVPDPNPDFTIEDVKAFLSVQFPEIINSNLTGPTVKNDKVYYEFGTIIGTKG